MLCLYCERKLGFLLQLTNQRFCCDEHHVLYLEAQHENAFKSLKERLFQGAESTLKTDDHKGFAESGDRSERVTIVAPTDEIVASATNVERTNVGSKDPSIRQQHSPEGIVRFLAMLEYDRHFYQEILDRVPVGIALVAKDLTIRYTNQSFRDLCNCRGATTVAELDIPSLLLLVKSLSEVESDRAEQGIESTLGDHLQRAFAVRLPSRDGEDQKTLLVVERPVPIGTVANSFLEV